MKRHDRWLNVRYYRPTVVGTLFEIDEFEGLKMFRVFALFAVERVKEQGVCFATIPGVIGKRHMLDSVTCFYGVRCQAYTTFPTTCFLHVDFSYH